MAATIKDIARIAGVSITTVSRALNGYSDVSPITKRRVRDIATQLGYAPNVQARSLILRRTDTIALIIGPALSDEGGWMALDVMEGLRDRLSAGGYELLLLHAGEHLDTAISCSEVCRRRQVDGVIIWGMGGDSVQLATLLERLTCPAVLLDCPGAMQRHHQVASVQPDYAQGVYQLTTSLIRHGHRQIAMINGHASGEASERLAQGYRLAIAEAHGTTSGGLGGADSSGGGAKGRATSSSGNWLKLVSDESSVSQADDLLVSAAPLAGRFGEDSGGAAMAHLLQRHPGLSAVVCANERLAVGALHALQRLGRRVPESVSVVCFGAGPLSAAMRPGLTALALDRTHLAAEAARLLLLAIEHGGRAQQLTIGGEIVERDSVQPWGTLEASMR